MMRSGLDLCFLGLLSLCSSAFGQDAAEVQHGVLIFCDDPSVEKAVSNALKTLNKELTTGHKLALFQILSAKKSENGSDSVYALEFTSRKSDCPAGSSKPWSDCDYLQPGHRAPISCNATVHVTETEIDTKQVHCFFGKYIIAEKAPTCMGCPLPINEDSEDLKVPLSASISKFNAISNHTHLFTLHSVGHATRQVIAGFRFKLRIDVKRTTCPKAEHKDLNDLCVPDEQNVEYVTCNATVDMAPWRLEQPEVHLQCEPGALPPMIARRRPPGWSPLREALLPPASSPPPSQSPPEMQPATNAPAKVDSSEEDTTASASPSVNDHPFHCPSKPWKPFKRVHKPAAPPAEGAFSDRDLLST
ncbi:kininogen-1 [Austrofundulus limnaeus]|uniref:Kininogen-1 n=1 Tax=Austrofundulus limnaeus TaxID=52670 RepID=A0A2I4C7S2_AUSLI|nr:PREDICTED: kininogen-like [Austrofundulus limnaeus]